MEHLHNFKFMSNWKFVSIYVQFVREKNIKLFLYEYRMWFTQELTENQSWSACLKEIFGFHFI